MNQYVCDFQTPPYVAKYMVSLLPSGTKTVLEPTPGLGNIVRELSSYAVHAPRDFFREALAHRYDAVVMNPPFSHKYTILEHAPAECHKSGLKMEYYFLTKCLQLSDNVIALMPWFTLSDSDVRLRALKRWGLISVTALPRKTFEFARIQTVVLQLQRGYAGPTEFKVFDVLEDVKKPLISF